MKYITNSPIFIIISLFILVSSCSPSISTEVPSSSTSTSLTPSGVITSSDYHPYNISLNLEPIPRVGEKTELTFTVLDITGDVLHNTTNSENATIWLEFWWTNPWASYMEAKQAVRIPLEEVVVSGETSWEGDYRKTELGVVIHSTIQLPREGIWRIDGYITGEGWEKPYNVYEEVVTTKESAAHISPGDITSDQFAYLDCFNYGFLKDKRKVDYLNEKTAPVGVELDITKAPQAGEEATVTCTILSLHDEADWYMQTDFYKRSSDGKLTKVAGSELLTKGELQWQVDLKQGEPSVFTFNIKFPQQGDWRILVYGKANENQLGAGDHIDLTISDTSFFGWKELPVVQTTNTTQNPSVTTTTKTAP